MTSACTGAYTIIPASAYGYTGKYLRKLDWTVRGCECQLPLVSDTSDPAKTQTPAGILLAFNGPPSKMHPQSQLAFDLPYPGSQCLVHEIPTTSLQWMMLCHWKVQCYPGPLPLTDCTCTSSLRVQPQCKYMPCSKSNLYLINFQGNTESKQWQCANIRYWEEKKGQKMTV